MGRPEHPNLAILTIGMGAWLFFLSGGITNIALPYLSAEFQVSEADVVWVTVAFQLAAVSFTIPFAGLSERIGVKKMYISGLIVFAVGSISCAFAHDFVELTAARVLQGLGAAGISSVNASLIRRAAPEHLVGLVVGVLAVVVGAAQGIAPIIGSFILDLGGWRWLFLYDLPLTFCAAALAYYAIPRDENLQNGFDRASAILCAFTLGAGFFAIDRVARAPGSVFPYAILAVAILSSFILIRRQRGRQRPLFPVDLLKLPRFALPGAISILTYSAQGVALTALPFHLVKSLDMTILQAGAMISILPLATLLASPIVGVLCDRFPRWPLSAIGCIFMSFGFAGLYMLGETHERTILSALMIAIGIGFSLFQNHNAKAMILRAPLHRMGAAGGVQSTARVMGMTIGPSIVGICFHTFGDTAILNAILIAGVICLFAALIGMFVQTLEKNAPAEGYDQA